MTDCTPCRNHEHDDCTNGAYDELDDPVPCHCWAFGHHRDPHPTSATAHACDADRRYLPPLRSDAALSVDTDGRIHIDFAKVTRSEQRA